MFTEIQPWQYSSYTVCVEKIAALNPYPPTAWTYSTWPLPTYSTWHVTLWCNFWFSSTLRAQCFPETIWQYYGIVTAFHKWHETVTRSLAANQSVSHSVTVSQCQSFAYFSVWLCSLSFFMIIRFIFIIFIFDRPDTVLIPRRVLLVDLYNKSYHFVTVCSSFVHRFYSKSTVLTFMFPIPKNSLKSDIRLTHPDW